MSDAWSAIKIREFEHVVTRPSESLLRVAGRGSMLHHSGPRPVLAINDGERVHRFSALSAPPDRGWTLRAAYAVSSQLVENADAYWLECTDGGQIDLPVPEPGLARVGPRPAEVTAEGEPLDAEQRIAGLEEAHAIALRAARHHAEDAEARAEALSAELAAAAERERDARLQLREAEATISSLAARLGELEQTVAKHAEALSTAEERLADALAARRPIERELSELRSRRTTLERDFEHARDQLRLMTMERDELSRQAQAFDEIAVKTRERAVRAEEAAEKATSTLQELEAWRRELEQRLATANAELRAERAARDADLRELERLRGAASGASDGFAPGNGVEGQTSSHKLAE